jgi:hypothetical protein
MIEIKKHLILERSKNDSLIRQIVKDIITIFKKESEGEYYLPEEIREDEIEYKFFNITISIELIIEQNKNIDGYMVNADFFRDDDIIVIKIVYNPENKNQLLYDLIGELNELVSHELRHLHQRDTEMFNLDVDDRRTSFEYYSSPEEIDAQVEGFKRMKKITKRPFEELVRNWFRTHEDIHNLSNQEQQQVIKMILDYNSKI